MTAKTMAEVLAWHRLDTITYLVSREEYLCICGKRSDNHEEHQSRALTAAGYGLVADAKAEALEEAAGEFERLTRIGRTPYDELSLSEKEDYAAFIRQERADWLRARAAEMRQG